jgi:ATP-dependent DNA helicase RecG
MVVAAVGDDSGIVQVVWFNQPYLGKHLKAGRELIVSGRLGFYRGQRQVVNPEFEFTSEDDGSGRPAPGIIPVYRLTNGVSQRYLRGIIERALEIYSGAVPETLPESLLDDATPSRIAALRGIHFPGDEREFEAALARLKLEELFFMQLALALSRRERLARPVRYRIGASFELEARLLGGLPFPLTKAQRRVLDEIHADLSREHRMNRLLHATSGRARRWSRAQHSSRPPRRDTRA